MSVLDGVVLLAALATALVIPRRGAVAATAALLAAQICWEGWYWHFAPLVLLLVVTAAWPAPRARWFRAARVLLALIAIAPWLALVPVPALPTPRGPYAVGSQIFRWVDSSRAEGVTNEPDDARNVIVQAWYPASGASSQPHRPLHLPYIDGLGRLPQFVSALPSVVMRYYGAIDPHAERDVAPHAGRWPVVVFSPGYGAARAFYSGLVADLASRGFVVLAVDHPYEAALTELANGQLVTTTERFDPKERDRTQYMARQLTVRAADVRFVLDQATASHALGILGSHLDTARMAVVGHSFGGATAALAAADDARVKAGANLDGTLYGSVPERTLERPFLLIESDHEGTKHSPRYREGNERLLSKSRAAAYRFEIHHANHYSFTETPFLFAWPTRTVLSWWLGGARNAADVQQATTDIVSAFLATSFGAADRVELTAHQHANITGGRLH
jgi:predicted dienelactone hydrolase